ncbi:MAG: DUF2807 domain-containing protein [Paraprevotella sp.]|nr:DUF2807 domain-containing protein [Paraprevotella sp.]
MNRTAGNLPIFPDRPSEQSRPGFRWEIVTGAGLKFWAQRDNHHRMLTDALLEEAFTEWNDSNGRSRHMTLKVFPLKNGDIEDVLPLLQALPEWNAAETCKFRKEKSRRKGVTRYVLVPDGDYADRLKDSHAQTAYAALCNGWGDDGSGTRYFEVYAHRPDKAVFVDLSRKGSLLDPESIVLTDDSLFTVKGELVLGHEACSFVACGDTTAYWVEDLTGKLQQEYDQAAQGVRNYFPVYAELVVKNMGPTEEGFAAQYAGVYEVTEIKTVKAVELVPGKNHETRKIATGPLHSLVTSAAAMDVVYIPVPGATGAELTAPDNILPYIETYADTAGTFQLRMKDFPQLSSNMPVSIELKTPPMTSFRNEGRGALIIKSGIESDDNVRITVNGNILCGPISCQDLQIVSNREKTFDTDQPIVCRNLNINVQDNGSLKLSGDVRCARLEARMNGNGSLQVDRIQATDVTATSAVSGRLKLAGTCENATYVAAGSGDIQAGDLQASRVAATVTSSGSIFCQALEKMTVGTTGTGTVRYKGRPVIVRSSSVRNESIQPLK